MSVDDLRNTRAKQPARTAKADRFNDAFFINRELSTDEKAALKQLYGSGEFDVWKALARLTEEGYRVTLKWDDYGDCNGAFMQTTDVKSPNFGKILTGRGRFPQSALMEVLYKHHEVFAEVWPGRDSKAGYEAWDD